jgi:ABC-2 type transport system ATP-binding protein
VSALTRIAARLEEADIELDDIGLQRPSLDDVFLSLTGHRAESEPDGATAAGESTTEASR